jgi:hypothetical protein
MSQRFFQESLFVLCHRRWLRFLRYAILRLYLFLSGVHKHILLEGSQSNPGLIYTLGRMRAVRSLLCVAAAGLL